MDQFPEILLAGDARQRGESHGEQLREPIAETLDYYRGLFGLGEQALREEAGHFAGIVRGFSADYAEEIESIARAASLDPLYVYALNSRSEIYNNASIGECTAIFSEDSGVLGQNWDWSEPLEHLLVLARIEAENNHRVCTLTEPGIIGKIGMNSAGLGVCLNILKHPDSLSGLPVHVLLRALLDCRNFAEAEQLLGMVSVGKASHVLVADATGNCASCEFAGTEAYRLSPSGGMFLHTNHYLAAEAAGSPDAFPTTRERMSRAQEMLAEDSSRNGIELMLRDQTRGEFSICRPYSPSASPGFGKVGTVFSVIMDLDSLSMQVSRGPSLEQTFYTVQV